MDLMTYASGYIYYRTRVNLSLSRTRVNLSLSRTRVNLSLSRTRVNLSLSRTRVNLSLSRLQIERNHQIKEAVERNNKFKVFAGEGQRLDGKAKRRLDKGEEPSAQPLPRGIPNYNHKKWKITFARASTLKASEPEEPMDEGLSGFQAFSGEGKALRVKKKK
jgi:hypothetical protein